MSEILEEVQRLLSEADIEAVEINATNLRTMIFEGSTVIGFVQVYETVVDLLERWRSDAGTLMKRYQVALQKADTKAWNAYCILLSERAGSPYERVQLAAIEEDLAGTRKIARDGVANRSNLRRALLPLLPIQNAPRLEAVDLVSEIELRTTELAKPVIEAFFSNAPPAAVVQIFEEDQ